MPCHISFVSDFIIPFISQGPKGPRGIKGASGDRGQMGERVSVGERERERQMCAIHHVHGHEVCECVFVFVFEGSVSVSLSEFQGEDGAPGNGTVGCHGFQVCVNSVVSACHVNTRHMAPCKFV